MRKQIFSLALALVMCLGLMPGTAFAAEALSTGLDFTSQSDDASGDGYSWTAETRTLTLNNFTQTISESAGGGGIAIIFPENTTLVLEGESTITNSCPGGTGIQYMGQLNIQGDGTLNLNLDMPTSSSCGKGIYEKKDQQTDNILIIEGGTLNITGKNANTGSNGYVGISGAEVHLNGGTVHMTNVTYGVNAYYWWVPKRKFSVNGGAFYYGKSDHYSGNLSYAVSSGSNRSTSAASEVSISKGNVDISGAENAFSVASTPVSVTGGSLNIHDLVRSTAASGIVQNTYAFLCGSGSATEAEPKICLTGGNIQISGCDYILSAVNVIGMDMLEVGEGMDLTGLVRVDEYAIYPGQDNLGASHVRICGDHTLPDSISFHEGNSGFWDVSLVQDSTLTIPQGMTFDLSKLSCTGEDFEIDGPGDIYDLSQGQIVNNGSLYLPDEPITTKERVAGLDISGNGDILVKDRQTGSTIATLHRVSYQDGNAVLKTGVSYIDGTALPYAPEKEGLSFAGWYKDADLNEAWDFDSDTTSEALTLYAKWNVNEYAVTFDTKGGTAIEPQVVIHNGTVSKPEPDPTREGYTFGGWYTDAGCTTAYGFSTPVTGGLTLYAKWTPKPSEPDPSPVTPGRPSSNDSAPTTYRPDVSQPDHGSVTVSPRNPQAGDKVTVKPVPDEGYVVDRVTVTDRKGQPVAVTEHRDGTYTFTQPRGTVTIEVELVPLAAAPWTNPYTDVTEGRWYSEAVRFVTENGLMSGYDNQFAPGAFLTRAQLAQVLYNCAERPATETVGSFDDVRSGAWYSQSVAWAVERGVVSGYGGGRFGPNDPITREQLAAMLWQYAGRPEFSELALPFQDTDQVSPWAADALRWAVDRGILSGRGGGVLDPTGYATRAEAAQMLKVFLEQQV